MMSQQFKCPECQSSLFHVDSSGNEEYVLKCYKTKNCKWEIKVKKSN